MNIYVIESFAQSRPYYFTAVAASEQEARGSLVRKARNSFEFVVGPMGPTGLPKTDCFQWAVGGATRGTLEDCLRTADFYRVIRESNAFCFTALDA